MARLCMRSGCERAAQVRLSYDTLSCHVWLDFLPDQMGMVQEICDFHAKRLTLPEGWNLSDRRVATPALFDFDRLPPRHHLDPPDTSVPEPDKLAPAVVAPAISVRKSVPRLLRGRHPSLNASELFGTERLLENALIDGVQTDGVQADGALTDEALAGDGPALGDSAPDGSVPPTEVDLRGVDLSGGSNEYAAVSSSYGEVSGDLRDSVIQPVLSNIDRVVVSSALARSADENEEPLR